MPKMFCDLAQMYCNVGRMDSRVTGKRRKKEVGGNKQMKKD